MSNINTKAYDNNTDYEILFSDKLKGKYCSFVFKDNGYLLSKTMQLPLKKSYKPVAFSYPVDVENRAVADRISLAFKYIALPQMPLYKKYSQEYYNRVVGGLITAGEAYLHVISPPPIP